MAKNALARRIQLALRLLGGAGVPSIQQIADEFGCSRRTILRDLSTLREAANLDIRFDRKTKRFSATNSLDLPKGSVNTEQLVRLLLAAATSPLNSDREFAHDIEFAIEQLRVPIGDHVCDRVAKLSRAIDATRGTVCEHVDWLMTLMTSIVDGQDVVLRYYERRGIPHETTVSPQRLVHECGQWWLKAWSEFHGGSIIFFPLAGIDLIRRVRVLNRAPTQTSTLRLDQFEPLRVPVTQAEFQQLGRRLASASPSDAQRMTGMSVAGSGTPEAC